MKEKKIKNMHWYLFADKLYVWDNVAQHQREREERKLKATGFAWNLQIAVYSSS